MTPDAREQARHISEVTKAFAEGKEIQFKGKNEDDRGWMTVPDPTWQNEFYDYRVKPEEQKDVVVKFWSHPDYPTTFWHEGFFPTVSIGESEGWTLTTFKKVLPETEME